MSAKIAPDLSWLSGRHIASLEKMDFSWFFTFDDGSTIATESFWRLVIGRVLVTSEDHEQMFGLKEPKNAAKVVEEAVGRRPIVRFDLDEVTGDLSLSFDGGGMIQFLTTSCGYEGWRTCHGDQSIICCGGGELAIFGGKKGL